MRCISNKIYLRITRNLKAGLNANATLTALR
jgi:hypothetical protein